MLHQNGRPRENYQGFLRGPLTHKDISEETLARILEGVRATFTNAMNEHLSKEITLSKDFHLIIKKKILGKKTITLGDYQNVDMFNTQGG